MNVFTIVGFIGGVLGIVGVTATAWAVARKSLKDDTINTQATHIASQKERIDGLVARVTLLEAERDECRTQLAKLQTTLDTVLERLDRNPSMRTRKADTDTVAQR